MESIGFGKRFLAAILDLIIFHIPSQFLQGLLLGFSAWEPGNPLYPTAMFVSSFMGLIYDVGMWTYADGATIGKKIMRIKIVTKDGAPLTFRRSVGRYFARILSALPAGLGLLWVIWDSEKRGWHDRMAGTKVITAS